MSIIGSQTITVDGVTATIDIILDEHAVLAYLGPRAMRNKSGRATISKNIPTGRTSLLIAEVRKATKRTESGTTSGLPLGGKNEGSHESAGRAPQPTSGVLSEGDSRE